VTASSGLPRLECCVWEMTLRCNLRCLHCGATAGRARSHELTTAEALRVADELTALPAGEVTLMGGELLLRPDWAQVAGRLRNGGVQIVVFTNGTLLTPGDIVLLRGLAPRTIGVSLDGGRASVHDDVRGMRGAFDRSWSAIEALRKADLRVAVITTLTRRNLYELPGIARLLAGRDIRWQVQVAGVGGERLVRNDLLRPLEFYFAALTLARLRATFSWSALPLIGAHDFGYCSSRLPALGVPGQVWTGCAAGRNTLGIRSDGRVQPCLSLPEDSAIGDLRASPLTDLWRGAALATWRAPVERYGYCRECSHGERCEGGCTGLAVSYSGRRGDNPMCLHYIERTQLGGTLSPQSPTSSI
jgi:radical SAM protein with 4Fe4S-binding SPASM domain